MAALEPLTNLAAERGDAQPFLIIQPVAEGPLPGFC